MILDHEFPVGRGVRLGMKASTDRDSRLSALTAAKPTWSDDLVLVCRKCQKKRGAPVEGRPLSKWLRRAFKSRGEGRRFRVVEIACLDLCPKRGIVLARGRDLTLGKPLRVFRDGDDPRQLMEWLDSGSMAPERNGQAIGSPCSNVAEALTGTKNPASRG